MPTPVAMPAAADVRASARPDPVPPGAAGDSRPVTADANTQAAAPDSAAIEDAPLVGRDRELAALAAAWRASTPDGRVVLVEGEAGIGKTRLLESVARTVAAGGGVVLAARGYPGESAIAYGPIAELLRAGLASPGGVKRLRALDLTSRVEVGRLVDLPAPIRVGVRADPAGPTRPAQGSGSSRRSRMRSPRSCPAPCQRCSRSTISISPTTPRVRR